MAGWLDYVFRELGGANQTSAEYVLDLLESARREGNYAIAGNLLAGLHHAWQVVRWLHEQEQAAESAPPKPPKKAKTRAKDRSRRPWESLTSAYLYSLARQKKREEQAAAEARRLLSEQPEPKCPTPESSPDQKPETVTPH